MHGGQQPVMELDYLLWRDCCDGG